MVGLGVKCWGLSGGWAKSRTEEVLWIEIAVEKVGASIGLVVEEGSSSDVAPASGCVAGGSDREGRFWFSDVLSGDCGPRGVDVGCLVFRPPITDSRSEYLGSVLLVYVGGSLCNSTGIVDVVVVVDMLSGCPIVQGIEIFLLRGSVGLTGHVGSISFSGR